MTPPREFVLLDHSAIGLGPVFLHLGAKLNWHRASEALIKGFHSDDLARWQGNYWSELVSLKLPDVGQFDTLRSTFVTRP